MIFLFIILGWFVCGLLGAIFLHLINKLDSWNLNKNELWSLTKEFVFCGPASLITILCVIVWIVVNGLSRIFNRRENKC